MILRKSIMLLVFVFLLTISVIAEAVDLRGRIDGINQYSGAPYPIEGVVVELFFRGSGGGWQPIATYRTGWDGMYFFRNIFPGDYVIQTNGRQNYPIRVFNMPYQDLAPVIIYY